MPTTLTDGSFPGEPGISCHESVTALMAAEKSPLYAYIVLSWLTGVRTEEAQALRWNHVELDGLRHRRVPTTRAVAKQRPELIVRLGPYRPRGAPPPRPMLGTAAGGVRRPRP